MGGIRRAMRHPSLPGEDRSKVKTSSISNMSSGFPLWQTHLNTSGVRWLFLAENGHFNNAANSEAYTEIEFRRQQF